MTIEWEKIKHFTPEENWGNLSLVDPQLVYGVDNYRAGLGKPVHLSPVEGAVVAMGGHSEQSYHYPIVIEGKIIRPGQAADIFPGCDLAYAWLTALRHYIFGGIGVYPYWKYADKGITGGLHLDLRSGRRRALWWQDEQGEYYYLRDPDDIHRLFKILTREP